MFNFIFSKKRNKLQNRRRSHQKMDNQTPQDDQGGAPAPQGGGNFPPRQMFQGDWTCSQCGTAITELPFEPDPARLDQLLCRDCHRQRRQSRGPRQY